MKMEQTECSEMSAYKIHTLGNYPEESIQHFEHSESLKWRMLAGCFETLHVWLQTNDTVTVLCVTYNKQLWHF